MDYLSCIGIYANGINKALGLVATACDKYDIDFDVFMDELYEDLYGEPFNHVFSNTIISAAFLKLKGLLEGHEFSCYVDGYASSLAIDGEGIYC